MVVKNSSLPQRAQILQGGRKLRARWPCSAQCPPSPNRAKWERVAGLEKSPTLPSLTYLWDCYLPVWSVTKNVYTAPLCSLGTRESADLCTGQLTLLLISNVYLFDCFTAFARDIAYRLFHQTNTCTTETCSCMWHTSLGQSKHCQSCKEATSARAGTVGHSAEVPAHTGCLGRRRTLPGDAYWAPTAACSCANAPLPSMAGSTCVPLSCISLCTVKESQPACAMTTRALLMPESDQDICALHRSFEYKYCMAFFFKNGKLPFRK